MMRSSSRTVFLGLLLCTMFFAGRALAQNGTVGGGNGGGGNGGGGNGGGGGTATCTCAPGEANCFSGINFASVNSTGGTQGTFTTPNIAATSANEVILDGCAVATATGVPVEVRWRVRADADPTKLFQTEGPSVSQVSVFGPAAGAQTFNATLVNYDETNPPVNFRLTLNPCFISLSTPSITVDSTGKTGQIAVSASPAACQWPILSSATWLHFGVASGTGSSVLGYTVDANTTTAERVGTATIGGQQFTVTQLPRGGCVSSISPGSVTVGSGSSSGNVAVYITSGCPWSAGTSTVPWLTVSGAGSGQGTATYTVAANNDTSARTGTALIAGLVFTVTQQGQGCTFIVNPTSLSFTHFANTTSINLTSAFGCPWSASSNVPWITLSPTTGSGPTPIQLNIAANTDPIQRTGTVNIAGQPVTVTQLPGICALISPTSAAFPANAVGLTGSVAVTAPVSCSWNAISTVPWVSVQGGFSGFGYGTVYFTVDTNQTGMDRSGTLNIGGNIFYVSQTGN